MAATTQVRLLVWAFSTLCRQRLLAARFCCGSSVLAAVGALALMSGTRNTALDYAHRVTLGGERLSLKALGCSKLNPRLRYDGTPRRNLVGARAHQ